MEETIKKVKEFNRANWAKEVLGADKPVLVDFWAPWCGPCRMQGPILEDLADQVGDAAVIGKLNTDEFDELASEYGVQSIPSLIVFKGGKQVKMYVGVTPADELRRILTA
jgi:thioredoxin 1